MLRLYILTQLADPSAYWELVLVQGAAVSDGLGMALPWGQRHGWALAQPIFYSYRKEK